MTPLELLAPAKNLACGIAAIDHGADAVYIGAPKFGARAAVGNSIDDIRELCDYAHQFGAKIYVTLNTIVYDNELDEVHKLKCNTLVLGECGHGSRALRWEAPNYLKTHPDFEPCPFPFDGKEQWCLQSFPSDADCDGGFRAVFRRKER